MRLLLDEHFDPDIARALLTRGHDVVAAVSEERFRRLADDALLARASAERRALVTENVRDFARADQSWNRTGRTHFGLIFTSNVRFPRHSQIGPLVLALDALLQEMPDEDALLGLVRWLASTA